jgi:hypothetical protein
MELSEDHVQRWALVLAMSNIRILLVISPFSYKNRVILTNSDLLFHRI